MKKNKFLFLIIWFLHAYPEQILIDKIIATVYHPEGTFIILKSDLRLDINGMLRTVEGEVDDNLMLFAAKRINFESTDQDIQNYFAQIQKDHNLYFPDYLFQDDQYICGLY